MAIREGRWDCPSCGSRGQLGRNVECAGCGAPRPQGIRFYLPGDEPPVTDTVRLAQARAGADWVCEHCGGSARATDTECPGCGAPRGGSEARPVMDLETGEVPHSSDDAKRAEAADRAADRARKAAAAAGTSGAPKPPPRPMTAKDWLIVGCTGCGGLGCLGFILLFLIGLCTGPDKKDGATPRPVTSAPAADSSRVEHFNPFTRVIVTDRRITRSVQVEELRRVVDEAQDPPDDAEILESHRAVVDHRRVFDHTEHTSHRVSERVQTGTEEYSCGQRDLGNGYFEDRTCTRPVYGTEYHTETESEPVYSEEPVYGTVYRYAVWRWLNDTTLTAESHGLAPPRWPTVRERRGRRAGERAERRYVDVRALGGPARYSLEVDTLAYGRLLVGDTVRAVIDEGVAIKHLLPIWRGKEAAAHADSIARDSARGANERPSRSTPRPSRGTTRSRRSSSRRHSSTSAADAEIGTRRVAALPGRARPESLVTGIEENGIVEAGAIVILKEPNLSD